MYVYGGAEWELYFENTRAALLRMQDDEGAWPNLVGPGDNFSTAVGTLVLEIPFGYLPIFQK